MNREFNILKITRANILKTIANLSDEQLVKIPQGHNNNILWNVGHIVSSNQKLTYALSGNPMRIEEELLVLFGKGTDPKQWKSTPDIKKVKEYLTSTAIWLEEDFNKGIFKSFKEYETSYGFPLKNIEDAISFGNTHEAVHFGIVMAMKKLV
jgi:hypothetical protein